MQELFLELVKLSLVGSLFAGAVMLLRILFRKAPKWIFCLLWGVVALRLILPISIESDLSLVPERLSSGQIIANVGSGYLGEVEILYETNAGYSDALEAGRQPLYSEEGYYVVIGKDSLEAPKTVGQTIYPVLSRVWLGGMTAMLAYAVLSYWLLKRRLVEATRLRENIWQSERVGSPFVLGLIRPRIYMPYAIGEADMRSVIAHERAHIRRGDHWWKPLGFLVLAVHWFNPVLWLAYALLCRDIEAACDEKVIKHMEPHEVRAYSTVLVNCSIRSRRIAACPLAFGEVGVKERIKHIMYYKKPAFWILLASALAAAVLGVLFLTDPVEDTPPETGAVPRLTATDSISGKGATLLSFGYRVSKPGREVIACGIAPWQGEYGEDNTLVLDGEMGQNQILLEPDGCTLSGYGVYLPDGTLYDNGTREPHDSLSHRVMYSEEGISLTAPSQPGEYIYALELTWPEGSVTATYGLKLVMTGKKSGYDTALEKVFETYAKEGCDVTVIFEGQLFFRDGGQSEYLFLVQGLPEGDKTVAVSPDGSRIRDVIPWEDVVRLKGELALKELHMRYPDYFGLDTREGLAVYIYQMAEGAYSCVLVEGDASATWQELTRVYAATLDEMRMIVRSYGLSREKVQIRAIQLPISSYLYNMDDAYLAELEQLFWTGTDQVAELSGMMIDSVVFDIDGDGDAETCTLSYGPTSGLFTFCLTVNGEEREYFNVYNTRFYYLYFEADGAGTMQIRGETQDEPRGIHYFDIRVENGNVILSENGEDLPYWGPQGPDSDYAH